MATSTVAREEIISRLRKNILLWEGYKPPSSESRKVIGIKAIEAVFPNGVFPIGAIHEMLCPTPEEGAAACGFTAGLLASLVRQGGICLWIGTARTLFPPALRAFGLQPHKIIFVDVKRERDVLWATEEALKCNGLSAVITEIKEINFKQSRRLQLAVEASKVTGFIFRTGAGKIGPTACTTRWQITPIPSELEDGLPGVGFPRWQVDLLKVRNGKPGSWILEWSADSFTLIHDDTHTIAIQEPIRKVS